ncbi:MAG: hypothetical protein KAS72_06025 [Phycisphaerales bacterium]|nr:hypothetical protein [Phycisphaerales bacterium]
MTTPHTHDIPVTFSSAVKHFNPAWFAAIMGTAVVPLAISFVELPGTRIVAAIFFVLSIVMFFAALLPWVLRFIMHPTSAKADFNHPVVTNFYPTMPISLIVIALCFLKYPDLLCSVHASHVTAFVLWVLGTIGIYVMGFVVLLHVFRHKEINVGHANFGWYIPPVSKLLIPVAGFELAQIFPGSMEATFGISIISLGIGFFLFLFVGAAVYHRYIYHELPMSRLAATFFVGIAPTAIIAVALFKLMHLLHHQDVLGISAEVFTPIAKICILMNWGLAVWWFIMAVILIVFYMRTMKLPYALSWWAFTFPTGALCVSTGVAWKVTNFASVHWFYLAVVVFLLVVWCIVALRTAAGMLSRQIFKPAH